MAQDTAPARSASQQPTVKPSMPSNSSVSVDVSRDSCGFYALSPGQSCRQPRSCYDCLNANVTAEPQGCLVSPYGACETMSAYSPEMDFRHNASSTDSGEIDNPHGGWWNMFPSANSTYCEPHDAACVRCREIATNASLEKSYMASTSKFCRGADGCVCIVGCEAPTWKDRVQQDCHVSATVNQSEVTAAPPLATSQGDVSQGSHELVWYLAIAQLPIFTVILFARARWLRTRRSKQKAQTHQLELSGWRALHEQLVERDKQRPPHAESVLKSALPPLAPSAADQSTQRPPLMTRAERSVWAPSRSTPSDIPYAAG